MKIKNITPKKEIGIYLVNFVICVLVAIQMTHFLQGCALSEG
jgi:hypothetical protein